MPVHIAPLGNYTPEPVVGVLHGVVASGDLGQPKPLVAGVAIGVSDGLLSDSRGGQAPQIVIAVGGPYTPAVGLGEQRAVGCVSIIRRSSVRVGKGHLVARHIVGHGDCGAACGHLSGLANGGVLVVDLADGVGGRDHIPPCVCGLGIGPSRNGSGDRPVAV